MSKKKRSEARRSRGPRSTSNSARLGDALDFMRVLWELDHSLRRVSKSMATSLGVTGPQRLVVRMVGRFPNLTAGDLASLLHVDPSSLTGVLERLGRAGLLKRRPDPEDGRRARFSLTASGSALDRVRSGTVEAAVIRALDGQPRARIAAARRVLTALATELDGDRPERTRSGLPS